MNFRFFGDSWFWTWYHPKEEGYEYSRFCRSQAMERIDKYQDGLSLMKILLEEMGHTVNNFAKPGTGFRYCRTSYEQNVYLLNKEIPAINIIFVSSNLRKFHNEDREFTQYDVDLSSVDNFIKCYDEIMARDLMKFMFMNDPRETYLVVSGQENLPAEVFLKAKKDAEERQEGDFSNWHLLSESILVDLACTYNGPEAQRDFLMSKTPRFGLSRANEIGVHMDAENVENIGEDVVSMFEEHNKIYKEFWNDGSIYHATILMTPDPAHLGFTGQVYFVDFVMKFLEENNLVY